MASGHFYSICSGGEKILDMDMTSDKSSNEYTESHNPSKVDSGRLGLRAWLNPTKYGWERVSYWLQRLTGVFLLVYFIGHIYETSSLVNGIDAWNSMLELTQTTGGHIFLLLVIGASTFHTVNGIRLIFTESGIGLGKPGRPDYPYDAVSLNYKQKSGIWVALLLALVAMVYGGMVMFGEGLPS